MRNFNIYAYTFFLILLVIITQVSCTLNFEINNNLRDQMTYKQRIIIRHIVRKPVSEISVMRLTYNQLCTIKPYRRITANSNPMMRCMFRLCKGDSEKQSSFFFFTLSEDSDHTILEKILCFLGAKEVYRIKSNTEKYLLLSPTCGKTLKLFNSSEFSFDNLENLPTIQSPLKVEMQYFYHLALSKLYKTLCKSYTPFLTLPLEHINTFLSETELVFRYDCRQK